MQGRQTLNTLIFLELIRSGQLTLPQFITSTIRYLQTQISEKIKATNLEIALIQASMTPVSVAALEESVSHLQSDHDELTTQLAQYQQLRLFVAANGTRYFFSDEIAKIKSIFSSHMLLAAEDLEVFDDLETKIDLLACHYALASAQIVDNYRGREGRVYAVFTTETAMKDAVAKLLNHFHDTDPDELLRKATQANTIELLSPQLIDAAYLVRSATPTLTY